MVINKQNRERFTRVAGKRTENIISSLRILSNCANTSNYAYNEEDVSKMLKAIKEELKIMETLFKKNLTKNQNKFKF